MKLIFFVCALTTFSGLAKAHWGNYGHDSWDGGDGIAINGDFWAPNFDPDREFPLDQFYQDMLDIFKQFLQEVQDNNECGASTTPETVVPTGQPGDVPPDSSSETQVITTPIVPPTSAPTPSPEPIVEETDDEVETVEPSTAPSARARLARLARSRSTGLKHRVAKAKNNHSNGRFKLGKNHVKARSRLGNNHSKTRLKSRNSHSKGEHSALH